jgi:hypothetical protein
VSVQEVLAEAQVHAYRLGQWKESAAGPERTVGDFGVDTSQRFGQPGADPCFGRGDRDIIDGRP